MSWRRFLGPSSSGRRSSTSASPPVKDRRGLQALGRPAPAAREAGINVGPAVPAARHRTIVVVTFKLSRTLARIPAVSRIHTMSDILKRIKRAVLVVLRLQQEGHVTRDEYATDYGLPLVRQSQNQEGAAQLVWHVSRPALYCPIAGVLRMSGLRRKGLRPAGDAGDRRAFAGFRKSPCQTVEPAVPAEPRPQRMTRPGLNGRHSRRYTLLLGRVLEW